VTTLGEAHGYTRLSIPGPGTCSGNLLGIGIAGKYNRVKNLWLGSEACNLWPFRDVKRPKTLRAGAQLTPATRHSKHTCRTCPKDHETLWHIICECPHPTLVTAREATWNRTRNILSSVADLAPNVIKYSIQSPLTSAILGNEFEELTRLLSPTGPEVSTNEKRFLMYWTLAAAPWPASVADPITQRLSFLLGKLFDSVYAPVSRVRNLADTWLTGAENAIARIADEHHIALPDLPPPQHNLDMFGPE